jgi:succinate dehydrogenase hydrophobic anchor subunit
MRLISILSAALWVDFAVMTLIKVVPSPVWFLPPTGALSLWYDKFGLAAVSADVLSLFLGVLLATFLFPGATGLQLVMAAIFVQMVHDIFFYIVVIQGLPQGQNSMIDVFKSYASEGSWKILVADALMITSVVALARLSDLFFSYRAIAFQALLGMYSLIYITYTK